MDDPSTIRPPIVLYNTVKYLRDVVMDQDRLNPGSSFFKYKDQVAKQPRENLMHSFEDVYSFLMDRFRQVS